MSRIALVSLAVASSLAFARPAAADAPAEVAPPPVPPPPARGEGRASAPRFLAELIGSGLVGGGLAYGTLVGACGDEPCLGGAIGAALVNIGVTPLAAWGIGRGLGGKGDLGYTYVGGLLPFSATAPVSAQDPGLALGIGMALMPLSSAAVFELTSDVRSRQGIDAVGVTPRDGGALVTLSGRF